MSIIIELYQEIDAIKEKLAKNGTTAVKFKEIKKFLSNFKPIMKQFIKYITFGFI